MILCAFKLLIPVLVFMFLLVDKNTHLVILQPKQANNPYSPSLMHAANDVKNVVYLHEKEGDMERLSSGTQQPQLSFVSVKPRDGKQQQHLLSL